VQGDDTWTVDGTSAPSYSRTVGGLNPDFELRVNVTSAGLTGQDASHLVNIIPPGANITGPASISSTGTYTWQANPSGGNGTYTYVWRYRVQGDATWTVVGTSTPSYSMTVGGLNPDFELRVDVTSAGLTGQDISHLVNIVPPGANITGPAVISSAGTYTWQANPSGGNGTYTYVWKYRVQGDATWTVVGTSAPSYSRTVGTTNPDFELRVDVTSAGLTGKDVSHLVDVAW
jgi:hypothetical protein